MTVRVKAAPPVHAIDQILMNEMFTYDAETGMLFWKKSGSGRKAGGEAGSRAGCLGGEGYRLVKVNGVGYREHRVIWVMHFGEIPEGKVVNHKDWNRANNKLENLEVVWPHENTAHGMLPIPIYCHETFTVYPSINQASSQRSKARCGQHRQGPQQQTQTHKRPNILLCPTTNNQHNNRLKKDNQ